MLTISSMDWDIKRPAWPPQPGSAPTACPAAQLPPPAPGGTATTLAVSNLTASQPSPATASPDMTQPPGGARAVQPGPSPASVSMQSPGEYGAKFRSQTHIGRSEPV